jgi:prepilin-type N-terminal cleavage/methylation domain-containing protein
MSRRRPNVEQSAACILLFFIGILGSIHCSLTRFQAERGLMSQKEPTQPDRIGCGSSGFSLMEILVVIAIMGIVLAISVPAYLSYLPRIRLREAAREIASDMQFAKVQAIKANTTTAVVFDPVAGTYQVITESGEAAGSEDWTDGDGHTHKNVTIANFKGVSYGSATGTTRPGDTTDPDTVAGVTFGGNVVFFTNKAISVAGTVYIHNQKGDTMAIGSTSAAGRVKTWRNFGAGWRD